MTIIGSGPGESHLMHFTEKGAKIRGGVIHVGASEGQEVQWYLNENIWPVLCFEPHPGAYLRGRRAFQKSLQVGYCNVALGTKLGSMLMSIPADGDDEKTSKYRPIPTPGHPWTEVPFGKEVLVPVVRFDEWSKSTQIDLGAYSALVIDVQGMELEVLQGFGATLAGFTYLIVELSERPMYDGEAPASVVVEYLRRQGFRQDSDIEEHQDVAFIRDPK